MKKVLFAIGLGFLVSLVYSQTAAEMDRLLAEKSVTYELASRFVLTAAGLTDEQKSDADCFALAMERGWFRGGTEATAPLRLDEFSRLCTEAFAIETGFLYQLKPGPRYAYRELRFRKFIQGLSDPAQNVSGENVIRIIGRILDSKGETL